MANLPEQSQWEVGIYQIETADAVIGGENGVSNRQAKQLASRTAFLRARIESALPPGCLIATYASSFDAADRALVCNGQLVSRATYADLFARIGIKYGAGDGSTTFGLPNIPNGYALLAGGAIGALVTGDNKAHSHTGSTSTAGNHNHSGSTNSTGAHSHTIYSGKRLDTSHYHENPGYNSYGANSSAVAYIGRTNTAGNHSHSLSINHNGNHAHTLNINAEGGAINAAAGMHLLIGITY